MDKDFWGNFGCWFPILTIFGFFAMDRTLGLDDTLDALPFLLAFTALWAAFLVADLE